MRHSISTTVDRRVERGRGYKYRKADKERDYG